MNTASDLVIYQAKAAISKACEGRKCLPDCLRRIERAEVGRLPPAPSASHGAKAAKRTPGAMRVHPAARVRAVAGAARAAWRAFAFRARSARGRVAGMLRALSARLSAHLRPLKNAIAAVALTLGVTCPAMRAVGAICTWNGASYTCNGEGGNYVVVSGGGGDGSDVPIVITNIVGTCTNCVAMSPEYVRNWKAEADGHLSFSLTELDRVRSSYLSESIDRITPYTKKCDRGGLDLVDETRPTYSNFFVRVGLKHPNGSGGPAKNKAAELVNGLGYSNVTGSGLEKYMAKYSQYDGAAAAFNEVADQAIIVTNRLRQAYDSIYQVQNRISTLKINLDDLSDEHCTAQWDGPSSISPDHGSAIVTNQVSGDWCTYEQGIMIIDTLQALEDWIDREEKYLQSVTNWISAVDSTIVANLNTSYGAIPSAENLGGDWRDVYLAGQRTQWGYEPTNILARMELLLYGLSGVGTNSTDVAEETGIDPTDADTAGDSAASALEDLSLDGSGPSGDFDTISDALGRFYRRFSSLTGAQFAGQQVSASYSVEIGEQRYDVPAFQLDTQHSRIANTAQLMCRSFLVILYLLGAAYAGFRFYAVFLAFVVKYAKWAQELLSSLFAD